MDANNVIIVGGVNADKDYSIKIWRKIIMISFLILLFSTSYAQVYDTNFANIINNIEDLDLEDRVKEEIIEELLYNNNQNKLINLNNASQEDMITLGLNNFQIFSLINYIKNSGQLFSLNELRFVNGFDKKTIERITPYVFVDKVVFKHSLSLDSINKYAINQLRFQYNQELNLPYGYTRKDGKGYKGDAFSSNFRYYFKYFDRMEFSIVADKDYGEPLYYKKKTYGYDNYNISFTLRDITKHIKQITIGDYRLNIGEGLAINQYFDIGYFSNIYGVKKKNARILPFRSTSEYDYNTGIATQMKFSDFDVFVFSSYNKIDYSNGAVITTGYHRTNKELTNKDDNTQTMLGASIQYNKKGLSLGLTYIDYFFKDSIYHGNSPYQKYYFSGNNNDVLSFNSSYSIKNTIFFSEIAKSMNNALAYIIGSQWNIAYKTNLSIAFRDYSKKFQNIYANAIGQHSNNQNEKGIYLGFSRYYNKSLSYFLGLDYYHFPFISYRANKDVNGEKIKMQLFLSPNNYNKINIYYNLSNHQYNETIANNMISPQNNIITQLQFHYIYAPNKIMSFVYRAGYSHSFTYDSKKNYGFYNYVEMILRLKSLPINLNLRYTYFKTSDYDNRFYVYEYSLPLNYSSSLLYKNGNKLYAMIGYKFKQGFQIYLRYSLTRYNNTTQISSNNNLIKGNIVQYLGGQIYYKF